MYTRWGILQNQLLATPLYDKVSFDARVVTFGGLFYSSPAPLPQTDLHGLFLVEFIYHHVAPSSSSSSSFPSITPSLSKGQCQLAAEARRSVGPQAQMPPRKERTKE